MTNMRILNLGCGVQSTTLFLMAHEGLIPPVDHAIFADTQEEPEEVYQHLAWLRTVPIPVPIIHTGTVGKMGDDLIAEKLPSRAAGLAKNQAYKHHRASIPAFTKDGVTGAKGSLPRQCTKEYKIEVVNRIIRRTLFGLKPRQRMPKDAKIVQLFGISLDEKNRSVKIRCRMDKTSYSRAEFPLIDMRMTRDDCKDWLKNRVPHETPRSACVFCPFKSPEEWERTKQSPAAWERAVQIDEGLRSETAKANRGLTAELFIHSKRIPLSEVDLKKEADRVRERRSIPLFEQQGCGDGLCGV